MVSVKKLEAWRKRYASFDVFKELTQIRSILKQEYLKDDGLEWVVSYSGGKDSSLVLTLVWEMLQELEEKDRNKKVHVIMSDTMVETPVMTMYQYNTIKAIERSAKEQRLDGIICTHMVKPPMKSRFFYKVIGRGTTQPSPKGRSRWCTHHLKISPIAEKMNEIIKNSLSKQNVLSIDKHAIVSLVGVRLDESVSRANSIRKFETDDLYAAHATNPRIKVMHPIKYVDLDTLWTYLETYHTLPFGVSVSELKKQYGKTGMECGLKDGSTDGEGISCGAVGSRSGCWLCPMVSGEDKMLRGLIEEGYESYRYLQEWKDYMQSIRNDIRFRLPTQRQKLKKHEKISNQQKEPTLFQYEFMSDPDEIRRNRFESFQRAQFKYAPGAYTIEARKRLLEYLLWIQERTGAQLISEDEIQEIYETWKADGYHVNNVTPTRHKHDQRLIFDKNGKVNKKETNITRFPIFFVPLQVEIDESDMVTFIHNKTKETGKFIPYLSTSYDIDSAKYAYNEYIFVVCTAFANTQKEAEHYVYSWLGISPSVDESKYTPFYEGWTPEEEGLYLPYSKEEQNLLSAVLKTDRILTSIKYDSKEG